MARNVKGFGRILAETTKVFDYGINISAFVELLEAMDAGKGEVEGYLSAVWAGFMGGRGFLAETEYEFVKVVPFTRQAVSVKTFGSEIIKKNGIHGMGFGWYQGSMLERWHVVGSSEGFRLERKNERSINAEV
jgi:hypothetical protein